jgi:hypothetical protein
VGSIDSTKVNKDDSRFLNDSIDIQKGRHISRPHSSTVVFPGDGPAIQHL